MADAADQGDAVKPKQKEARLFKVLCCPVNTKTGRCIVDSLYRPYVDNEEDHNIIIGRQAPDLGSRVPEGDQEVAYSVRKVIDVAAA